jgi:hypothetical protein
VLFQLDLGNPRSGWLDVTIVHRDRSDQFAASSVLNDPVAELVELALFIVRGERGEIAVRFWLEPEWYELRATRGALAWRGYAVAFEAARVVASEILRALRELQPQVTAGGDHERWPHAFPTQKVDELAALLRGTGA